MKVELNTITTQQGTVTYAVLIPHETAFQSSEGELFAQIGARALAMRLHYLVNASRLFVVVEYHRPARNELEISDGERWVWRVIMKVECCWWCENKG
jgi:hypothetical protein